MFIIGLECALTIKQQRNAMMANEDYHQRRIFSLS
jgi:hypothetical protein